MPMLERSEGDIHYEVCDIVPPWQEPRETILFLHGLAVDSDMWITWLPTLADHYRIIRVDLRGFGRSFVRRRALTGSSTRWPTMFGTCSPRSGRSGCTSSENRRAVPWASISPRTIPDAC